MLKIFKKKNKVEEQTKVKTAESMTIDISKKRETLDLRKKELVISLKKKNAEHITARVVAVMDKSGSMDSLYRKKVVQEIMERIFPIALEFDDDGELEAYLFENNFTELPPVTLNNFHDYQEKEMDKYGWGGTRYAPVMEDIVDRYKKYSDIPTYVLFFTDGDNSDKRETTAVVKEASKYPIFWQFVGIGRARMSYLEELDDMEGRIVDNADFFQVSDIENMSDKDLYDSLLNEFPDWFNIVKEKGFLK